ncbi:hypothetical protein ACS0TY_008444 [Phlomoides rotata]
MENLTPSSIQTLLATPTNHVVNCTTQTKNAMKNFQELVFKLAETHPNRPLNPAAKTLLQCRLNRFASEYRPPDHPPYSSMIETSLKDLNEKTGSSVESISQHLEKSYDNLPFAHSVLLKNHLEKLGETGEIVVTRDQRYGLPGHLKITTQVKRGPRRRKWARRKQKLLYSQKCEEDEVEYDENEQRVTENGAISENKLNQTQLFPSGVNDESLPLSSSTEIEIPSAENSNGSKRKWRLLNRLNGRLPALTLTSLKSRNEMETSQDQQKAFDSSTPKCRRLRVMLKPKPDTSDVEDLRAVNDQRRKDDCTLLHCNAKQTMQPTKRRPGRPPKRAVVT